MGRAYIGTSGWQYAHWRGSFYPQNLPQKDWLRYYAKYFETVEVNATFYHQMKPQTFENWRKIVGPDFVFSIKGSRFITHVKRLKDCQEELERFFESADFLREEKNVVLWQLPPGLKKDVKRLEEFIGLLPSSFRHAFEFRHESWVGEKTWEVFKKYNVAAIFQDWHEWPQIREITTPFIYLRFHGNRDLYASEYTEEELKEWSRKIGEWTKKGLDVYAYFNNDAQGFAIPNAQGLKELVGK